MCHARPNKTMTFLEVFVLPEEYTNVIFASFLFLLANITLVQLCVTAKYLIGLTTINCNVAGEVWFTQYVLSFIENNCSSGASIFNVSNFPQAYQRMLVL